MVVDAFGLSRFLVAQEPVYESVLRELTSGEKRSHWMWFIFPQIDGLGSSATARHYAIRSLPEAAAYLQHPVLGPRLKECCGVLLALPGLSADQVFGTPDDLKLRSSLTLFARASPPGSVFERLLGVYFDGVPDERTVLLIGATPPVQ